MDWRTLLKFTTALLVLALLVAGCSQPVEPTYEEKEAEALRIALSDTRVLDWIDGMEYKVLGIDESMVQLTKPPDERLSGTVLSVYIDIEAKKVTRISTHPRKALN